MPELLLFLLSVERPANLEKGTKSKGQFRLTKKRLNSHTFSSLGQDRKGRRPHRLRLTITKASRKEKGVAEEKPITKRQFPVAKREREKKQEKKGGKPQDYANSH